MFSMQADETGRIYATVHGLLVGVSHKVARQRRKRRGEGEQEGKQLQSLSAPPLSTPLLPLHLSPSSTGCATDPPPSRL